jgi:hypothetical protein
VIGIEISKDQFPKVRKHECCSCLFFLCQVIGIEISKDQFPKVRKHKCWPDPCQLIAKAEIFRQRVNNETIVALLHHLERPGTLQTTAFGTKLVVTLGGHDFVTLENVERSKKAPWLAAVQFRLLRRCLH